MGAITEQLTFKGEVKVRVRRWDLKKQLYKKWKTVCIIHNGFPDDGIDWISAQLYTNTSAGTRGAGFIALSNNGTAPDNTDTVLAGELVSADMQRTDAGTKTHTDNTNVTSLKHTFTASATRTGIVKTGLFNASSSGILVNEALIASTDLNSGDQIEITWTITGPTQLP
ncbi:MAG TPA: hypothetical protein VL854_06825 [Nitrososphaeraceae archaeon]|nr:hypothetical protein [Nitrososphaeraceae archaeon]